MTTSDDAARDEEIARLAAVVAEHRAKIAAEPDNLYPQHADALMDLAAHLADAGRGEEALAAALEGVEHFQSLATVDAVAFGIQLASALNNLSNRLDEAGKQADAARAGGEAIGLARAALPHRPEQGRFVLMSALMNQAGRAWRNGNGASAVGDMVEATSVFREGGDAMAPWLGLMVEALHRNAMALAETGLWEEAVQVRRLTADCFADAVPSPVYHLLALTLEQAAHAISAAGHPQEALPLVDEAVRLARALAEAEPERYRLFLAQSLSNHAARQHEAGAHQPAMDAALEAIAAFQEVAKTDAASAILPLSVTLETFAAILRALGHPEQAETVLQQRDGLVQLMEEAQAEAANHEHGHEHGGGCGCGG